MATEEKKRYWLKLDKDFLKSSQIKVIKNMPNGKDYVIFYLALMLESVETIGHLRFSNLVPYNEEMLASVTDTNVDIVRTAVKIFESLGLMEILDDGTIYMTQVAEMTGKESESAERVRRYRLKQKQQLALQGNGNVTNSNDNKEKQEQRTIKNNNEEIINNNLETTTTTNIYSNIESNFGRTLSPMEYETIQSWLLSYEENIINYAVRIAIMNNKRTFNYVNGILKNWKANGYSTLQDIKDHEEKPTHQPISEEKQKELDEIFDYDWLNDSDNDLN